MARSTLPGYVVNRAARLFARALSHRLAPLGLTTGQWPILLALLEEGQLTQAQLSRRLNIEQPTTANTLKRMERDGLVYRVAHPTDRRQEHIHLTDHAHELAPELAIIAREINALALEGFTSDESETLMRLLHRTIANLDTDPPDTPAP